MMWPFSLFVLAGVSKTQILKFLCENFSLYLYIGMQIVSEKICLCDKKLIHHGEL